MESTIRLFAGDCIIYRKITKNEDIEILQKDLDRVGEWAVVNVMRINPSKSKAILFMGARSKVSTKLFVTGHINTGSEQL